MEHIVCNQIGRHLDLYIILHPSQHAFRKGLSCETHLIDTIHEVAYSINQKKQKYVIFLDFSKARNLCIKSVTMGNAERPVHESVHSYILADNKLSSTDKHRSQLMYSRSTIKKCVGPYFVLMYITDSIIYRQIHTTADHFTLAADLNKRLHWAKNMSDRFYCVKMCPLVGYYHEEHIGL